jgi:hypothetical protein
MLSNVRRATGSTGAYADMEALIGTYYKGNFSRVTSNYVKLLGAQGMLKDRSVRLTQASPKLRVKAALLNLEDETSVDKSR